MAYYNLRCHFSAWIPTGKKETETILTDIKEIDRSDSCFFWQYRQDMGIRGAEILQAREAERKELARERSLTTKGLWVAVIALIVNTFFLIINVVVEVLIATGNITP